MAERERSDALTNEDLAPVPLERRTWNLWHFAALWVGMAVCVPTYTIASGLIRSGLSWKQALWAVLLGNLIVLVPLALNGHAGAKYGIPFPVLARASFGVLGANVPAVLRALVACGWFGIQTWFGGKALWELTKAIAPSLGQGLVPMAGLGIDAGELAGFVIFWLVTLVFILKGTESIKWLETLSAPFLIVAGLALLAWAFVKADGFGPMLEQPSQFDAGQPRAGQLMSVFVPSLTAMVGFWATLSLNIPDFTRYARSQRDQTLGQALGLPTTMLLFAFIGIAVTSASPAIFGEMIWDPVTLVGRMGNPIVIAISMFALAVATLSTNIAANVVSPANDFSNLSPRRISYRTGAIITATVGALIMPWRLTQDVGDYIYTWLVGYSALLGPVAGIMIADYYIMRGKRLVVEDLYRRGGAYEYVRGFNWRALVAFAAGVTPCVPGFVRAATTPASAPPGTIPADFIQGVYDFAWFVSFGVGLVVYVALTRLAPVKATVAVPAT